MEVLLIVTLIAVILTITVVNTIVGMQLSHMVDDLIEENIYLDTEWHRQNSRLCESEFLLQEIAKSKKLLCKAKQENDIEKIQQYREEFNLNLIEANNYYRNNILN